LRDCGNPVRNAHSASSASAFRSFRVTGSISRPRPSKASTPRTCASLGSANTTILVARSPAYSITTSPTSRFKVRPSIVRKFLITVGLIERSSSTERGVQVYVEPVSTSSSSSRDLERSDACSLITAVVWPISTLTRALCPAYITSIWGSKVTMYPKSDYILFLDAPEHHPECCSVDRIECRRREWRRVDPDLVDHVAADRLSE